MTSTSPGPDPNGSDSDSTDPAGTDPNGSLAALASIGGGSLIGRGRPRKLDRAAVTRAALAIVEEDGLAGLTMRRAADRLGVGLATLYNAVGSKEAILEDMIEAVFGRLPEPDHRPGRELDGVVELWVATHELLLANPVVAQLIALRRFGGSGLFGLFEGTLVLLREAGVPEELITTALQTVRSYTLGFSLLRVSRSQPAAEEDRHRLVRESTGDPERYPEIARRAPEIATALDAEHFETGLRRVIQGFLPA